MLGGALMNKMRDMVLEAIKMNGIENVVMPLMNEIFLSFTNIAGTRYCNNQEAFKTLEKNVPLLLEREADNKYDSNGTMSRKSTSQTEISLLIQLLFT